MYKSIGDILRTWTKTSLRTQPLRDLRGRVWLNYALHQSELDLGEFAEAYVARGRARSNLVWKWQHGLASPSKLSVAAIEESLPGTRWVYDLPLWELLRNEPMSLQRLKTMVNELTAERGVRAWWFPGDDARIEQRCVPIALYPDTDQLVARNDIWGLVGCVLRTRLCEQNRAEGEHTSVSMNMFRALPGALKLPGLRPYAEELFASLNAVRARVALSLLLYDVDIDVVLRQADDPTHQPWRECRKRDPETLRFVDIEDPVLPAEIIGGFQARDRVIRAEARSAARRSRISN